MNRAHVYYDTKLEFVDFFDINSPVNGHRGKMVDAIFKDFPKHWHPAVMDWDDDFWDRMKEKFYQYDWLD